MIAALEVMTAKEEMKSAHDARKAAGAIEDKANEKKLDDMKTQADWKEAAGISEGAGSMVEGGLDVAGAKWGTQSTKAGWEGAGKGAGGLGKLSAALFNAEADSAGRSKESDEMQVEHAKRAWQGFNDDVKDFRELLSAAIKFYGEWASAKVQSEQAAIHRT
jgi:hypothetical protein